MTINAYANSFEGYHTFRGLGGSFEVFYDNGLDADLDEGDGLAPGWYWWACFPGCLPDGEASGPFDTSGEAYDDAQSGDA